MPLLSMPPRAPIRITAIGTLLPRPNISGLSTLSERPPATVQTVNRMDTSSESLVMNT